MSHHPSPEHEALCRRCGRCCYEKIIVDCHVFTTRKPCRFLDVRTNLCRVYERRFEANPRCLNVAEGITHGVFPADCPYVRDLSDYLPAEEGWIDDAIVRKIRSGAITCYEELAERVQNNE